MCSKQVNDGSPLALAHSNPHYHQWGWDWRYRARVSIILLAIIAGADKLIKGPNYRSC